MDKALTSLGAQARDLRQCYVRALTDDDLPDRVHWLTTWSLEASRVLYELGMLTEEPPF